MSPSDSKEWRKQYRDDNKDRMSEQNKVRYKKEKTYLYYMLKRAERRAKEKGLEFDLTVDDVVIPELCPILGVPLVIGEGKGPKPFSPSLDKINPDMGYTKGNVVVISMRANQIKSNASLEEIEKVCQYLREDK